MELYFQIRTESVKEKREIESFFTYKFVRIPDKLRSFTVIFDSTFLILPAESNFLTHLRGRIVNVEKIIPKFPFETIGRVIGGRVRRDD